MVQILKMYNGYNDIEILKLEHLNYRYEYKHVLNLIRNRYYKVIKTDVKKTRPPHNFTIMNGKTNAVISREFVEFILTNEYVQDLIEWSKDMFISDEILTLF